MKKMKILVILTLAVILSGCYKFTTQIDVDPNGKANISATVLIEESMLDQSGKSIDEFKGSLDSFDENDYKLSEVKETIDGDKYIGWKATSKKKLDFKNALEADGEIVIDKKTNIITIDLEASDLTNSLSSETEGLSLQDLESQGVEMNFIFTFQGEIIKTNGALSKDKKTVTYDLLTFDENKIEIKANLGETGNDNDNTTLIIAVMAAIIVVIAGVAFILYNKKKKLTATDTKNK